MQSLPQKLEAACAALVLSEGISVPVRRQEQTTEVALQVFTGLEDEEKAVPALTVAVLSGQEFPQSSGNFTLNVAVEVRSNAEETDLTAHRQLCEDALEPLMKDDTETQLNTQAAIAGDAMGVMGISNRSCRERVEEKSWVTELTFDAYCCGLVLT